MFGFGKKKISNLSWLGTEIHSHLLPGIDDGVPDIQTSLEMIKGLSGLGYTKIITTPHVLWDMYPNTTDVILRKNDEVKNAITSEGIDIEFSSAAEYYIDEHFMSMLKEKKPLLTLKEKLVLVEFSMITAPFDLKDALFELQMQGYEVLIAHPERYIYLKGNKSFYEELHDGDCHFQLNLLSLTGFYGRAVQDLAEYLLKNDFYTYAGTDLHNERHLSILQQAVNAGAFNRLEQHGGILNNRL
jgi:protein-tyrosine phosphatase